MNRTITLLLILVVLQGRSWAQRCAGAQGPDRILSAALKELMSAAQRVRSADAPLNSAEAWFQLNQTAGEVAEALNREARTKRDREKCSNVALDASAMGIPIYLCEFSAEWIAGNEGYLIYHQFLRNGPRAEDAWWYGGLGNTPHRCTDYRATKGEGEHYVPLYQAFLHRFPHGKHATEAKEMLKAFEDEAKSK